MAIRAIGNAIGFVSYTVEKTTTWGYEKDNPSKSFGVKSTAKIPSEAQSNWLVARTQISRRPIPSHHSMDLGSGKIAWTHEEITYQALHPIRFGLFLLAMSTACVAFDYFNSLDK